MSPNLPAKRPTDTDQRLALVRKVQETQQAVEHSWHDLRRDSLTAAVGAASVYVGYRIARWLLGGGKKNKQPKQAQTVEIRYVEAPESKRGNGFINVLLARAGSIALDIFLEKVQDNLPLKSKKDK